MGNVTKMHEAFSAVHASGDLMKEVLSVEMDNKKTVNGWVLVRRVAACAAVLAILLTALLWPNTEDNYITGPGLITVRAHEVDEGGNATIESVILEEGVEFVSTIVYDPTKSYVQHFPFSVSIDEKLYPGMDITMEVSTDAGIFYKNEPYNPAAPMLPPLVNLHNNYYGQHFTVNIDENLYWKPNGFDFAYLAEQIENGVEDYDSAYKAHGYVNNPSFIDIIIRADDYIVGYCVIAIREINENDDHPDREFSFEVLTIVNFPEVEGKLQNVAFKYVQEEINRNHREGKESI